MQDTAAITVSGSLDEVQRLWREQEDGVEAQFKVAPGDRGTEVHVTASDEPLDAVKERLRRFKRRTETGEVPTSDMLVAR
jgi:hypothetical protein